MAVILQMYISCLNWKKNGLQQPRPGMVIDASKFNAKFDSMDSVSARDIKNLALMSS